MEITSDDVIEELKKLEIKEHFDSKNKEATKYIVSKEELITFCIKLVKVIKRKI